MSAILVSLVLAWGQDRPIVPPASGGADKLTGEENNALVAIFDEIDALMAVDDSGNLIEPLTSEKAEKIVGYLFYPAGNEFMNYKLQMYALTEIEPSCDDPRTPLETLQVLKRGLRDYHEGGGGVDSPIMTTMLAQCFGKIADGQDAESLATFEQLSQAAVDGFTKAGKTQEADHYRQCFDATAKSIRDLYVPMEGSVEVQKFLQQLRFLARKRSTDANELRLLTNILLSPADNPNNDLVIEGILRAYSEILRKKSNSTSSDVAATVESGLIRIASIRRVNSNPEWRLWKRWAEAASLMARHPHRLLKDFVNQESRRVRNDRASARAAQAKSYWLVQKKLD